jgi:hypothetical protein
LKALTKWEFDKRDKESTAKEKEKELKSTEAKQLDEYSKKANAFREKTPDFVEVLEAADDVPMSFTVRQAILKTGPELAYLLAKNPEELERISKLHPIDAAEAIGEFKAIHLKAEKKESKEIKTTKAPAPITPVGSKGSGAAKSIGDPNLSQAEYEALRMKQIAAKYGN